MDDTEFWQNIKVFVKSLGVPKSKFNVWKNRKFTPPAYDLDLKRLAQQNGVNLTDNDLQSRQAKYGPRKSK